MKYVNLFVVIIAGLFLITGCDKVDPTEKTPTYLKIDSFHFQPTPGTGTSSHKITSVWVYLEGRTIGAFDLPATVPVLADEPGQITLTPGITFSGLNDVQTAYPFYRSDTFTLNPQPGEVVSITPVTSYLPDTALNILELDFETGNPFYKTDGDTALIVTSDPQYRFEGDYGGLIVLDDQSLSVNLMQTAFIAPTVSFLEINYRNTVPFQIGLQTTSSTGQTFTTYILGLHPRNEWNKVYIGLQDFVNQYPNRNYRIVVRVLTENPQDGFVALDNLKVISGR